VLGGLEYESITAYGQYWLYDANGAFVDTGDLNNLYGSGPCAGYAPKTCRLRTRAYISNRVEITN